MKILQVIFWLSSFAVLYTSIIYIVVLNFIKNNSYKKKSNYFPTVSLIISAYNEEKTIKKKLSNTFELDYPKNKIQIIVANDGSSDNTMIEVSNFENIDLLDLPRGGKTNAQNEAVKIAKNEFLIFSDANNIYEKDAIQKLVANFADDRVGVVCGELRYRNNLSKEHTYWNYEVALKKAESRIGRLVGANGSIYAVRRDLYKSLPKDSISDLLEPMIVYGNGFDIVYEPNAIAVEDTPREVFSRKRRIILRSLGSIKYVGYLLNPFHKRSLFITFVSHKLLRWFLPIFLFIMFFSSGLLYSNSELYFFIFLLQVAMYTLGLLHSGVRYFIVVNFASAFAIWDWLIGKKQTTWSVVR
jgi:cellulose synthase/poly-beta-1,6-N-acetylglucosamine synthase-like glycosyltransferase|tara:strand:- start:284 stop:1351 length:1068 start_codon:yes stop_codon:yes gene_type:complete